MNRTVRILGIMSAIGYLIVLLGTWVLANFQGYIYFSAGEPDLLIKYTEWILGGTSIVVLFDIFFQEIRAKANL